MVWDVTGKGGSATEWRWHEDRVDSPHMLDIARMTEKGHVALHCGAPLMALPIPPFLSPSPLLFATASWALRLSSPWRLLCSLGPFGDTEPKCGGL